MIVLRKRNIAEEKAFHDLEAAFAELLSEKDRSAFLVDMSHVEIIHSIAIGILVKASSLAKEQGCRFALCRTHKRLLDLFAQLKCLVMWETYEDCEQARTALGLQS